MVIENLLEKESILRLVSNKKFSILNNHSLEDIFFPKLLPLNEGDYNVSMRKISEYEIDFKFQIKKSAKLTLHLNLENIDSIVDEDNIKIEQLDDIPVVNATNSEFTFSLSDFFFIDENLQTRIEQVTTVVEITVPATMAVSFLPLVIFQKFNFFWSLMDCVQLASFFLLLNIEYPPMVKSFLESLLLAHFEFIPDQIKKLLKIEVRDGLGITNKNILLDQKAPHRFHLLNISANLIENAGSQIQMMILSYILIILVRLASRKVKTRAFSRVVVGLDNILRYSLLISVHNMVFMKLIMAANLQLTAFSSRQVGLVICYLLSIFILVYFVIFLIWIFFKIHHPNFWLGESRHLAKFSILISEIDFDRFYSKSHFVIILINKYAYSTIIVWFQPYPFWQILLLCIVQLHLAFHYFFTRPMLIISENYINGINSLLFIIIYLLALNMHILYENYISASESQFIDEGIQKNYFAVGWAFCSLILLCMINLFLFYLLKIKKTLDNKRNDLKNIVDDFQKKIKKKSSAFRNKKQN